MEGDMVSMATKGECEVGVVECPLSRAMGEPHQKLQAREAEWPCVEQV